MRKSATTLASELSEEELSFLRELLKQGNLTGRHLEIGTAAGGTLLELVKCYQETKKPPFVVVDPMNYFPDQYAIIKKNLVQNSVDPDEIDFRISRSYDAFQEAEKKNEQYDFVFIDGAHNIRYVTEDLSWARLLRNGGLLCLHDYHPTNSKGVVLAADRFLRKYNNYTRIKLVDKLLVIRKDGESLQPEVSRSDHVYANVISPLLQLESSLYKRIRRLRARLQ